jgi:hypothetical protein
MGVSGRRYYSPSQGRFLGRDPIEESGGINLYGFCGNNAINRWDLLGMEDISAAQCELIDRYFRSDPRLETTGFTSAMWERIREVENESGVLSAYDAYTGIDVHSPIRPAASGSFGSHGAFDALSQYADLMSALALLKGTLSSSIVTPNSGGGSALGNALRGISLLGGILGSAGDILAGAGNSALGIVSISQSGTFARGIGQIGFGLTQTVDIMARDVAATFVGVAGTAYLTVRDIANIATLGQISALGNRDVSSQPNIATGVIGALTRTVGNALIPEYGAFGGLHWGRETVGPNTSLILNQSDVASFNHDGSGAELRWVRDQYTTKPTSQWVGPVGAAYALLGTIPFSAKGAWDKSRGDPNP